MTSCRNFGFSFVPCSLAFNYLLRLTTGLRFHALPSCKLNSLAMDRQFGSPWGDYNECVITMGNWSSLCRAYFIELQGRCEASLFLLRICQYRFWYTLRDVDKHNHFLQRNKLRNRHKPSRNFKDILVVILPIWITKVQFHITFGTKEMKARIHKNTLALILAN